MGESKRELRDAVRAGKAVESAKLVAALVRQRVERLEVRRGNR